METLPPSDYRWIWSVALAVALFFPVRQLIWVLAVRREQARRSGELPDEAFREYLKGRAGITAGLLCIVFVAAYGAVVFGGGR